MKINQKLNLIDRLSALFVVFALMAFLLVGIGWVKNIIKLTKCDFKAPYKAEIIRCIGVVPLIGAVTGWLTIEDGQLKQNNGGD